MVAPTRTPQARGQKCDLCKNILTTATWLDQTKLAKDTSSAKTVLKLINEHIAKGCPCIPKNIENLLIGSTEFEIHRLLFKNLDNQIHRKQIDHWIKLRSQTKCNGINDCYDERRSTRFNLPPNFCGPDIDSSKDHLKHLRSAIDFWRIAMEDETNPFNSKLALRLGLTHHVIYACYLFKYYRILDYQLITANLLLNVFRSIEGVTDNAVSHAVFLLVRTLVDCGQLHLAHSYLKQAQRSPNYKNKTSYESILLTTIACEIELIEHGGSQNPLEDLVDLITIRNDDKLQHYYARTLAMSTMLRYIHLSPIKSNNCFEFYHTYRYLCAIIRRCYENSFDLILNGKQTNDQTKGDSILDHSWIRYAICDFVYSTFDLLFQFYQKAGCPESIEILYNGLSLIAFRNNCHYWQSRLAAIGVELDIICDKLDHARSKLNTMSEVIISTNDPYLKKHLESETKLSELHIIKDRDGQFDRKEGFALLDRAQANEAYLLDRTNSIELYDCTRSRLKTKCDNVGQVNHLVTWHRKQCLRTYELLLKHLFDERENEGAMNLIERLKTQLNLSNLKVIEYYDSQTLLEIALYSTGISHSTLDLLSTVSTNNLFLHFGNNVSDLGSQLSTLSLSSDIGKRKKPTQRRTTRSKQKLNIGRRSKFGNYEVASELGENTITNEVDSTKYNSVLELLDTLPTLATEEIVLSYLRNSEPNPHYLLYRRAHEVLFRIRLTDISPNHEHLLYHFFECASNTIRYRWMMFEEQQVSPYDCRPHAVDCCPVAKNIGFSNSTRSSIEKLTRQFIRTIPDDYRLVQIKYILNHRQDSEHLLILLIDNSFAPVYIHTSRGLYSYNFFSETRLPEIKISYNSHPLSLVSKISAIVQESRKTFLLLNHDKRTEIRQRLETDLGSILDELEDELLGALRFLTCGSVADSEYNRFITRQANEIISSMKDKPCKSNTLLELLLENAPFISRNEFCSIIAVLFEESSDSDRVKESFKKWQKSIETFIADQQNGDLNKLAYCQKLTRGPVGLILDNSLVHVPFESLPLNRIVKQGIFRVPSLRVFGALIARMSNMVCSKIQADPDKVAYLLDPANNLNKTRERFEHKLKSKQQWSGIIGQEPQTYQLEDWLSKRDIYLFIGHGAGTAYYNRLCNGRGLSSMPTIQAVSIVMGCSSGKLQREGPLLEPFGICWVFILRGSPSFLGLLWDVTDTDIDRFFDKFLCHWLTDNRWTIDDLPSKSSTDRPMSLTDAVALARSVCRYKHLVGSTPVVYGLPVWLRPG